MKFQPLGLLVVAVLLSSPPARATVGPPGCQEPRLQKGYVTGLDLGARLTRQAWASLNDCGQLPRFSEILKDNLRAFTPNATSEFIVCRYLGMNDGALAELHNVWSTTCGAECCSEGQAIGALSANLYCTLSVALQGVTDPGRFFPRQVNVCQGFAECCSDAFTKVSQLDPICQQYTAAAYFPYWQTSRDLMCVAP